MAVRNSSKKRTSSVSVNVRADVPDVKTLVDEIADTKKEMLKAGQLRHNKIELYRKLSNAVYMSVFKLEAERERSKHLFFHVSSPHNGHRYYFSKRQFTVEIDLAQASCAYYGGYLAEIDDSEEFNFVARFLDHFDNFMYVYIGMSDAGHEGIWVNMHSRRDVTFLPWSPGEPNAGADQNCACMHRFLNYKYVDGYCYSPDAGASPVRYLCEVDEA